MFPSSNVMNFWDVQQQQIAESHLIGWCDTFLPVQWKSSGLCIFLHVSLPHIQTCNTCFEMNKKNHLAQIKKQTKITTKKLNKD